MHYVRYKTSKMSGHQDYSELIKCNAVLGNVNHPFLPKLSKLAQSFDYGTNVDDRNFSVKILRLDRFFKRKAFRLKVFLFSLIIDFGFKNSCSKNLLHNNFFFLNK